MRQDILIVWRLETHEKNFLQHQLTYARCVDRKTVYSAYSTQGMMNDWKWEEKNYLQNCALATANSRLCDRVNQEKSAHVCKQTKSNYPRIYIYTFFMIRKFWELTTTNYSY